jgi:hypothetical protein
MPLTPLTIALVCSVLAGVITWSAFLAIRGAADQRPALDGRRRASAVAAMASVALASLGVKWWLLSGHATSVPFLDAWEGEGLQVYLRLFGGDLRWSDLLAPHNEHRIAIQRLVGLGLLTANGQWDARLQLFVSGGLHVLAGAVLLAVLWQRTGGRLLDVLSVLVLLVWALPFAPENALIGFQLSFYLLVLFFVLALGILPGASPGSARWYLGAAALLCSLFTLGSGVASAVAVGVALALGWLAAPAARREGVPGLVACLAIVALGLGMAIPSRLPNGVQFDPTWHVFRLWMAWPASPGGLSAVLTWLPVLALTAATLGNPLRSASIDRTLVAIGVWVALNGAAVAYGRAAMAEALANRYLDIVALGLLANGAACVALWHRLPSSSGRALCSAVAATWCLWTLPALAQRTEEAHRDVIPALQAAHRSHGINLRHFIETADMTALVARNAPFEIPHHNASLLAGFLTEDTFRASLPPDLQRPLPVDASPSSTIGTFVRGGTDPATPRDDTRPSTGSYTKLGSAARGRFESTLTSSSCPGYLRIDVAGDLGRPGIDLRLVDPGGHTIERLATRFVPGPRWETVFVPCPDTPFSIVAEDDAPDRWVAFRHPVVYGPLSATAFVLARMWKVLMVGAGLLAWLAVRLANAPAR